MFITGKPALYRYTLIADDKLSSQKLRTSLNLFGPHTAAALELFNERRQLLREPIEIVFFLQAGRALFSTGNDHELIRAGSLEQAAQFVAPGAAPFEYDTRRSSARIRLKIY